MTVIGALNKTTVAPFFRSLQDFEVMRLETDEIRQLHIIIVHSTRNTAILVRYCEPTAAGDTSVYLYFHYVDNDACQL